MLQTILDSLNAIIANQYFVAIGLGLVISLAGTQWLKFRLWVPVRFQPYQRWWVRVISLPLGWIPTALLWPGTLTESILWGLAVGLSGPAVYRLATAVLYKLFPHLEGRLSVNPWRPDE